MYKLSEIEKQILDFLSTDPSFCLDMGLAKNLGDLPDPGKNARLKELGKIKMFSNLLSGLELEDQADLLDRQLWLNLLEMRRLRHEIEIDGVPKNMRMPKASRILGNAFFMLMANDPRPAKFRLVNIISKLEKTPEFLNQYQKMLHEPVRRWLEMELSSLEGLPHLLDSMLTWAESINFDRIEILNKSISKAKSALIIYQQHLKRLPTSENIHIGHQQMQLVLKARGIQLSPAEIHQIAKDFFKSNQEQINGLKDRLLKKYQLDNGTSENDLKEFLGKKFQVVSTGDSFDYLLERYRQEHQRLLNWIEDTKLFPMFDEQSLDILATPEFLVPTIPAGAMICPLPLREGHRKSLIYLTLRADRLEEHTNLSIPNMMIHEGVPGHHLQLAWATKHERIVRRLTNANDLAEGWTTMLEDFVLDQGYAGDKVDEMRFIAKKDIARLAARVGIDLYFMSGDKGYLDIGLGLDFNSADPFENAAKLLKSVTGFSDARAQGELNWYSQESGYPLSYLIGNHLMLQLKNKLDLDDFEFHKYILSLGKVPLSYIV